MKRKDIDTKNLFINIKDYLLAQIYFYFFIGGRGVGKTYSTVELLKDEEIRNLIYKVNIDFENPEELFSVAQDLVYKVEMGLVPDDEMETTEQIITVLLAAIQDKVIIKKLVMILFK